MNTKTNASSKKIRVKKIVITRGEGPIEEAGKSVTALNFAAANEALFRMSATAPKSGGYDKTDFVITFADGQTYKGRYDLKHYLCESPDLSAQVVAYIRFNAGLLAEDELPTHIKNLDHYRLLTEDFAPKYREFFEKYDLGYAQDSPAPKQRRIIDSATAVVQVGQEIHCALYGGRDGVVTAIHGEQSPKSCESVWDGVGRTGGTARFDIVFENGGKSHQLPETILRGVQWEIYNTVVSQERIDELLANADKVAAEKERERKKAAAKFKRQMTAVRKKYDYLKPRDEVGCGGTGAAKNIRIELKREFPGIRFSVRSRYDSVNVRWTDGPTAAQVKTVIDKYEEGSFNGMEDIYEYDKTPFTEAFGGCRYVSEYRDHSDKAVAAAIKKVFKEYAGNLEGIDQPSVEDFRQGRTMITQVPGIHEDLQQLIHQALAKKSWKK